MKLQPNTTMALLTGHNSSANPAYSKANFPSNFSGRTYVNQGGATVQTDSSKMDDSRNPVTPAHISDVDVHTLIPSRPDLRWFSHLTPWWGRGGHVNIGVNNNTTEWVASAVEDMVRRGFDGCITDWYGKGSYEDNVTLLIQKYLSTRPNNKFTLTVQIDHQCYSDTNSFESALSYCKSQYFGDPNYEKEGGVPILMFFSTVGGVDYGGAKSKSGNVAFVFENYGSLGSSYTDGCFEWVHDFHNGFSTSDPYNLGGVKDFYVNVAKSPKKVNYGSMVRGFNGTLTKNTGWSQGKDLPTDFGKCWMSRAAAADQDIPANVTRIQVATWNDWEEGSAIEPGIQSNMSTSKLQISGTSVSWTIANGQFARHVALVVSSDGDKALSTSLPANATSFDLSQLNLDAGDYKVTAILVGQACIQNVTSDTVTVTVGTGGTTPPVTPPVDPPPVKPPVVPPVDPPPVTPPVVPPVVTGKGNLTIRSPKPGSTVRNPVQFDAEFSEKAIRIEVWAGGKKIVQKPGSKLDQRAALPRSNGLQVTIQAILTDEPAASKDHKVVQVITINVR